MVEKLTIWIKTHPITVILIFATWYLSLFTPPHTPLDNIRFIDKWTHIAMYGVMVFVLYLEDWRWRKVRPGRLRAWLLLLCPVVMSGAVELVQEYCTADRVGDWLDMAANTVGGVLGFLSAYALCRKNSGKNN